MPESAADGFRMPSLRGRTSPGEWQARVELAACYRMMEAHGMADMGANHILFEPHARRLRVVRRHRRRRDGSQNRNVAVEALGGVGEAGGAGDRAMA
jgi:hypothetical protein